MTGATTCAAWDGLLRDGESEHLTPERTSALRLHLRTCAGCRARYAGDLDLIDALARVPLATPPAWQPPRASWRRAVPIAAAAAVLLSLLLFPGPRPPPIVPVEAAPVTTAFEMVERRFRLGDPRAVPYVITTKYHSVINHVR